MKNKDMEYAVHDTTWSTKKRVGLCCFLLIALLLIPGFAHEVYAVGGDVVWQKGDTPQAGKQEAQAMALDSTGATIITGFSDQSGSEDYYTIKIVPDGSAIASGWPKVFDKSGAIDHAEAIVVDSANNIIVTGYSQTATGDFDFHTIKYAPNGVVLWQKSFDAGLGGNDYGVSVAVDGSNNVYVGGNTQNASANDDFILIKYPAAGGNPVWQKIYNGPLNGEDRVYSIAAGIDGIAITGESQNAALNFDCLTIKYDFNGNLVWSAEKRHAGSGVGNDHGLVVRMDSAGDVIMAGTTYGTDADIHMVKYDGSAGPGTVLWEKIYDGGNNDEPVDVFIDSSDNVYVTGYHTYADASNGFYTVKYNSAGTFQWEDLFHSSANNNDRAIGIVVDDSSTPDNSGAVFVSGYTFKSVEEDYDFQTLKYTIDTGKLLWQATFDGTANLNDRPVGIGLTSTGDVITGGWCEVSVDDYDYYALKYERGLLNRPTDLALTVVSTTRVDLSWTDNSSNETGFKIERKEGDSGSWSEIYAGTTPGEVLYSDTPVDIGTKYYYRVRAYNGSGSSNYSNEEYAVTTIQTYTPYSWKYNYGNPSGNEDTVTAAGVGPDNDPVVTGRSYSSLGQFDYYTVKLNRQSGSGLWDARYDSDQNDLDMATTIAVDGNDDVLVSGWSLLYSIAADDTTNDIYTLKYPSTGPPESWSRVYAGPSGDDDRSSVVDVSTDGQNNYVVVGYGRNVSGNDDIYVLKYDIDGNIEWEATPYDRGYNDYPIAAAFGPSGAVFVVGYSSNGTDYDFFTAKYDSNGDLDSSWSPNPVIYSSGYGDDIAKAMAIDSDGNIYVTGLVTNAAGNADFYTVKYNGLDGSEEVGWPVTYGGYAGGFDEAVAIALDPVNGEVVVAGSTYTVNSENDFHVIRYNTDGSLVWQRTLDRPDNNDFAVAMGMDLSGNVHIAGDSYNAASSTSDWDVLSIQYDHNGSFVNGTIVNGAGDSSDGATSITVNTLGEAFVGGYEDNIAFNSDYLVVKLDGDELQVPLPFEAAVHYVTVDFTWVDNSEDETSYQLQRNDTPGTCDGPWSDIYNSTGTLYADDNGGPPGLTPDTYYCYRIRTYKDADEYSRWVEKNITTVVLPPPAGLNATQLNTSTIFLTWTDTTTSESKFNIERCEAAELNCPGSDFSKIGEAPANAESYTDTTACEDTEYYYRINAQKTSVPGWTSGYSNETNATTDSVSAPDGLTTTSTSEVQIDLEWTDNTHDDTAFKIERCLTSSCTFAEIGQTTLDSSIVMLLNMDKGAWQGTAGEVTDSSGSANNGTARQGATTTAGGQYGYAGSFDGTDDYVSVPNHSSLNILDDLTVELWFKPAVQYDSSLTDYVVLLDRQWSALTDSYFLGINADGKLHMDSKGGSIQSTQTTWLADTWYHVVVTYRDVSGVYSGEMYINGVSETLSVNSYDDMAGGSREIGIAGSNRFNNFEGNIDRVVIYDRGLTVSEADDRFNNIVRYSDASVPSVNLNYTYRVRAFKTAAGCAGGEWNSEYSTTASADSNLVAPGDLTATAINTTRIDLTWTDNTGSETGFKVFRCVEPCTIDYGNDDIIEVAGVAEQGTTVEYSDMTVCEGTKYRYGIKAVNSVVPWESSASNEVIVTTDTGHAPGALSVLSNTESLVDFEWTDNTNDETGYKIERCKDTLANCSSSFIVDGTTIISTLPSDNVMLLNMDESLWDGTSGEVTDSSGSGNNGQAYGNATTDSAGKIERAGIFDGSGDYLRIPHSSSLEGTGDFTIELWIKPIDQNTWQGLVAKGDYRYLFALNDSGNNFRLAYYGSGWQYGSVWHPYNVWTHVAVTFDGNNSITFFVNGQPEVTRTIAGNQASSGALLIGQWGNNYWYEGLMDEVAVYDRALTDDEIQARYERGLRSVLEGSATGGSTTEVEDTAKSWTVNEWTDYYVFMVTGANAGEVRKITSNTSDTLTIDIGDPFGSNVVSSDDYIIVKMINGTDSTGLDPSTTYTFRVLSYKTSSGCAGGEWNSDPSNMVEITTTAPEPPDNVIATTIDTTDIRLDWNDNTTSETDFEIERRCTGGDDCPVEDQSWHSANIDGDPGPNDTDNATYTDDGMCENTTYEFRINAKKDPGWTTAWSTPLAQATTEDYVAPSGLVAETITEEQIDLTWIDNTTDESSFKIERCAGSGTACDEDIEFTEVGTLGTTYGDLLVFHMDEASWGTVIDSSENGSYNGTAYGGATTDPGGKFGRAGSFNGSSQYVTTLLNIDQSSSSPGVTMAAWVKPTTASAGWHHVISTDDDGYEWTLARDGGTWKVITGYNHNTLRYFNSGLSVDVGEWQHIAAVFTPGVGVTFYKNGAAATTTYIGYNTDDRNVTIGRRARDANYYFDGLIDEVAIYSGSLSFAEIYQLDEDEWKEDTGTLTDGDLSWAEDTSKSWAVDEWVDYYIVMVDGNIAGETRKILSNTADRLTIEPFSDYPDISDTYNIITYLKGTASSGSTTTITTIGKNWAVDDWANYYVVMETGANAGLSRRITSNTANTLTVEAFDNAVVNGNSYKIMPYLQGAQSYGTKDTGTATNGTTLSVTDTSKSWTTNEWQDFYVLMETGLNSGEMSQISSNTSDTLNVTTAFSNAVIGGDVYKVVTSQSFTKRFSDTGLTIGQTYSYRVRGYKDATCEWPLEYSNIDFSTISPPAPTNLTATAGGTTQIDLEWTDNTETETGFKLYRCDSSCTTGTATDGITTEVEDTSKSWADNEWTGYYVLMETGANAGISRKITSNTSNKLNVEPFDNAVASGNTYKIFPFLVELSGQAGTGVRSYTDTAVSPGVCESQQYSYIIAATSSSPVWDSYPSNTDSATAVTANAPTGFTATPESESQVNLSWNDNTMDETGFKILRCAGAGCDPVDPGDLLTIVEPDFETFSDTGLAPDTDYEYEVHAYKTATCPWDKEDSVSTSSTTITAPVLTLTPFNTTQMDLAWTDNTTSETGFTIERCEVGLDCPTFAFIATVGPDVTEYSDSALCNSNTYTYRVKPINEGLSNSGGGCWTRKVPLTITNFEPNYQTKVEITDYNDYTNMQPDFDDIRFYDETSGLELPYFIESKVDGTSATIYIKTLVNNNVYMYYGNTSATSSGNIDRVYDFYDDFQGTSIDTAKWEEIDPNNSFTQNDVLQINDAGSDGWSKALISQKTFDRNIGKVLYVDLTTYDTGGNNHLMVGWELNQSTNPSYTQLVHGFYWNNSSLGVYEKGGNQGTVGSYGWSTSYEMKIILLATGAKYYIKGGAFSDWTLIKETSTYSDSPMRIAFTQHSHEMDIRSVKVQDYAAAEPSVAIGSEEQDDNCYVFNTWASPPYSDEESDTTPTPVAPSNLAAATVSDTQTQLTWTDNTIDETGFKVERCLGTSCTPVPPEIGTATGYDTAVTMMLHMEESSWHGTSGEVVDSAGSNNGTSYGGANTADGGKFGRAGIFDGATDYVSVPNSSGVNPTDAITVSLWAKSDSANWNASGTLASKRNAYMMYPVSGSKEIRFYVYTTLQWFYTTFTPTIDITQWHHYTGTYDGNEIKLYIDGAPVGTPTLRAGGINYDPGALYIGRDDGQSSYFKGMIDDVAIYNIALTDAEVQDLNTQGIPSNTIYLDTVSPSASYCYQVRAYKTAGACTGGEWNSGYSNSTCKESPPATPANLQAVALNSMFINLSWDGSGVDNELGFEIERRIWGGTYIRIAMVGPNISVYNDTVGVGPDEEYTYRIRAYNSEGVSDYSNEASEITPSWQEGDSTCE